MTIDNFSFYYFTRQTLILNGLEPLTLNGLEPLTLNGLEPLTQQTVIRIPIRTPIDWPKETILALEIDKDIPLLKPISIVSKTDMYTTTTYSSRSRALFSWRKFLDFGIVALSLLFDN